MRALMPGQREIGGFQAHVYSRACQFHLFGLSARTFACNLENALGTHPNLSFLNMLH